MIFLRSKLMIEKSKCEHVLAQCSFFSPPGRNENAEGRVYETTGLASETRPSQLQSFAVLHTQAPQLIITRTYRGAQLCVLSAASTPCLCIQTERRKHPCSSSKPPNLGAICDTHDLVKAYRNMNKELEPDCCPRREVKLWVYAGSLLS